MKDLVEPIQEIGKVNKNNKKDMISQEIKKTDCKLFNFYSYFNNDDGAIRFKNFNQILDLNQIFIKKRYLDPNKDKKEVNDKINFTHGR